MEEMQEEIMVKTLDVTDVCTGWRETEAVKNKAQIWSLQAMGKILWSYTDSGIIEELGWIK